MGAVGRYVRSEEVGKGKDAEGYYTVDLGETVSDVDFR